MVYDENLEDALTVIEQMGDQGRKAMLLAGLMWEEKWRETLARAERAEWLFERIQKWSTDWGLCFDVTKAAEHWDQRYQHRTPVLVPWHDARIEKRRQEIRELRLDLESARDAEERATTWALRERARAEAAESECDALMAEIHRLRRVRHG
ncbi:MAG TPA: hypothetical protein VIL51_11075 [Thermoleophilia bacterium]